MLLGSPCRLRGAGATRHRRDPEGAAGRTHTSTVSTCRSFTVPDGWVLASDSRATSSSVRRTDLLGSTCSACRGRVPDAACPVAATVRRDQSTDLVTWIRACPSHSQQPRDGDGGRPRGFSIDLGTRRWTQSCPFADGLPTVPLLVEPGTGLRWVIAGGERLRLYILDLPDGGTLLVDIDDFEGSQIDAFLGQAAPIVKSLQFASG